MSDLWRERYPDEVTCIRCLEVYDTLELDRLLWCESCRVQARRRATRWGWLAGAILAAALGLWIWWVIRPDPNLIVGGWIATVVAAFYIGSKVAREIAYGVFRFQNRKAAEAVPPKIPTPGSEAERDESDDSDLPSGPPGPTAPPPA